MNKRLNLIATVNLLSYITLGLTYYFKWSPTIGMIAFMMSIVVLAMSTVNLFLACKEEKSLRNFHLKRIIYQMLIAIALVVIYMGRFNH